MNAEDVSVGEIINIEYFGRPLKEIVIPLKKKPGQIEKNKIRIFDSENEKLLVTFYEYVGPDGYIGGYKLWALPTERVADEYVKKLIRGLLPAYKFPRSSVVIKRGKKIVFNWVNK